VKEKRENDRKRKENLTEQEWIKIWCPLPACHLRRGGEYGFRNDTDINSYNFRG
jgi:hypothetical protein